MRNILGCLPVILCLCTAQPAAAEFEFRDGDRVVLLGGTLIEREQRYGYWETALTAAHPERSITFRNLGWSGDTVWAESRGIFDPPAQGYARMLELVGELDPTVIIVGYGNNEAFAGESGLESFVAQYNKLLDDIDGEQIRFILLAPLPMEQASSPLPDVSPYNDNVQLYAAAIESIAAERDATFVPLTMPQRESDSERGPTDNGQHLTAYGYWSTAPQLRAALCGGADGPALDPIRPTPTGRPPTDLEGSAATLEDLRTTIVRKNELFFHRWRPQNITYLFGFRKHEQGNNAVEIAQFDPLIAEQEQHIAKLRSSLAVSQ